jgi:dinuclear metal center YbgI/SA1388 family protein
LAVIALDDLIAFLDSYMGGSEAVARIDPQMANGLQVRGRERVGTIVTGVSASVRFFEEASALGADALVVHHSLNMPAGVHFDYIFSHRLRVLFERGLSLIGYHYLLDSHPEVGNNAQIVKQLGATLTERYTSDGWGWVGEFDPPMGRDDLLERSARLFGQVGVQYPYGPAQVNTMVAISGSGAPRSAELEWLIRRRIDLFVTGEPREYCREMFREAGITLVAAGHYPSERLGVLALTDVLRRELDTQVHFLDLPNPV